MTLLSIAGAASVTALDSRGFIPGNRILNTIYWWVSDYFAFGSLVVQDLVSDGHTFIDGFTPVSHPYLYLSIYLYLSLSLSIYLYLSLSISISLSSLPMTHHDLRKTLSVTGYATQNFSSSAYTVAATETLTTITYNVSQMLLQANSSSYGAVVGAVTITINFHTNMSFSYWEPCILFFQFLHNGNFLCICELIEHILHRICVEAR
jgi:hypothetical protein